MLFFFSGIYPGTCHHFVKVPVRQFSIIGNAFHPEIDVPTNRIGKSLFDETADDFQHLGYFTHRPGIHMRRLYVECFHVLVITFDIFLCQFLHGNAALICMGYDIILDVGNILDMLYLIAPVLQVTADYIEKYIAQGVSDMRVIIRVNTTDIHFDFVTLRYEVFLPP